MSNPEYWQEVRARVHELEHELAAATVDRGRRQALQKELAHLTALLQAKATIERLEHQLIQVTNEIASCDDIPLQTLFKEESETLSRALADACQELELLMFPPDKLDDRGLYLEIRSGAGGDEASLFVSDLVKMYLAYAERRGWRAAVEATTVTDLGGFREVVLHVEGHQAYGCLKFESGVHRVQRVPLTEASGRVHTSTVTVAVLPEADEVDVQINPSDLRIDVFRASGAGGQHVNTTDSAVRITHLPSGFTISCQDERSQHKNKAKALKILHARLMAHLLEKQHEEVSKTRKEQIGTGMRSEKVRTYNFPQNRVTDHRVNVTLNKLDRVLLGDLDEIVVALRAHEKEERRKGSAVGAPSKVAA